MTMNRLRACLAASALLVAALTTASAQTIPIKTIPIAQADRYSPFPSHQFGMGGVSIALVDTLLDLSVNPASGARLTGGRIFSAPVLYSVSREAGSGGAIPIGAVTRLGPWFGGLSLAAQLVSPARNRFTPPPVFFFRAAPPQVSAPVVEPNRSAGNQAVFAALGRTWGSGFSVGASASWSRLNAVDGVDMLYGGSQRVRQRGHAADYRLGVLQEWPGGQTLEAVALRARFRMTHDVTFLDFFWDPGTQQVRGQTRPERNLDHSDTWGLHLAYQLPLAMPGWRVGAIATANKVHHSEMPNFQVLDAGIKTVPWDPGDSYAYNLGVGVSRTTGPARVGVDLIYEPIWSHTWGEAAAPLITSRGDTIPPGGVTVDNRFEFSNVVVRMGASRDLELGVPGNVIGLQLGLMVRANHYWLAQYDQVQAAGRNHEEQWMEWTPTWGWSLQFPELEIRYHGRVTNGTGRPGVIFDRGCAECAILAESPALLPTPVGVLSMGGVSVTTHQVSISLPLGRAPARGGVP